MMKLTTVFKLGPPDFAWKKIQIIHTDGDDEDDDIDDNDNNGDDDYSCNSVNFQDRASNYCMVIDVDNINIDCDNDNDGLVGQ